MPGKKNILKPLGKTAQTAISPTGYSIVKSGMTPEQIAYIKKDLTLMKTQIEGYGKQDDKPIVVWLENDNKIYIPRHYGLKKIGVPNRDKLNPGVAIAVPFVGALREYQLNILKAWDDQAKKTGGGIISVGAGRGKTVMAIAKIADLKVKTLIVVWTEDLLDQWRERIEEYMPSARIGEIRGKKLAIMNKDIVIAMIQSLSNPKKDADYPQEVFKEFGFVIYDECHHVAADMFSRCLKKTIFKYTMGLSATPNRTDGLTRLIKYYLGEICYKDDSIEKTPEEKALDHIPDADIRMYNFWCCDVPYCNEVLNYYKKPQVMSMQSNIADCTKRNDFVLSLLPNLLAEGRKILILVTKRDHVADLLMEIKTRNIASCGPYVGGMKLKARNESKNQRILIGTYKMVEEGFDCQALDTLLMVSPVANEKSINQSTGRIMRKVKNERILIPLIIDIVDQFSCFPRWNKKRVKYYAKRNYRISSYDVNADKTPLEIKMVYENIWQDPTSNMSAVIDLGASSASSEDDMVYD